MCYAEEKFDLIINGGVFGLIINEDLSSDRSSLIILHIVAYIKLIKVRKPR